MSRRVDGDQDDVAELQPLTIARYVFGSERIILTAIMRRRPANQTCTRPFGQLRGERRMVAVSMRDDDPANDPIGGIHDGCQMPGIVGSRVEDGDLSQTQQVRIGPGSGHQPGIGRNDTPYTGG
jgi:hypothetical protein